MPAYLLRSIDAKLWGRVKARAEKDVIPLRAIILALLELYAAGKVHVQSTITASRSRP